MRYLEPDELMELIDVAGSLDAPTFLSVARGEAARHMRDVEARAWAEIGAELGVATSTAICLYRRPTPREVARPRQAILATLGCSGLGAQELCELDRPDLDLATNHAPRNYPQMSGFLGMGAAGFEPAASRV